MGRKKNDTEERFDEYYSSIYRERWPDLKKALSEENPLKICPPGLSGTYYMDASSYLTASLLPLEEDDTVLDMCAAPGGKTLVIATHLSKRGRIVANDRSPERRRRMRDVFSSCLGPDAPEIRITGYNAESWGLYEKEMYDSILLDAPCSSERHVMSDRKYLLLWSPSRPKRLSRSQYAMLSSALMAVRKGGYILYSTCSINPGENEEVIDKLIQRHEDEVEILDTCGKTGGEKLLYGSIILPDRAQGRGPMYSCLIRRKESDEK